MEGLTEYFLALTLIPFNVSNSTTNQDDFISYSGGLACPLELIIHIPSCWSVLEFEEQAGASVDSIKRICSSLYPLLSLRHTA